MRHTGYVDRELRDRKLERDLRLLRLDLQDRPGDPFINFNLGAVAIERRQWDEALGFLERSLADSAPTDSIVRKLYALIARAHQMKGDSQAALETCARGLQVDPEDAELWFRKAVVHRHRAEPAEAEHSWRRILGLSRPNRYCSVDQGIYGHHTRRNLAALAAERGDRRKYGGCGKKSWPNARVIARQSRGWGGSMGRFTPIVKTCVAQSETLKRTYLRAAQARLSNEPMTRTRH